jgi:RNA polymerase sigma factor FliA
VADKKDKARVASTPEAALINQGLCLIDEIARGVRYTMGGAVDLDDLRSAGHFALVELVRRYDPERSPFDAFIRSRVRWAMYDDIRRNSQYRNLHAKAAAIAKAEQAWDAGGLDEEDDEVEAKAEPKMPPSERAHGERFRSLIRTYAASLGVRLILENGREIAAVPSSIRRTRRPSASAPRGTCSRR